MKHYLQEYIDWVLYRSVFSSGYFVAIVLGLTFGLSFISVLFQISPPEMSLLAGIAWLAVALYLDWFADTPEPCPDGVILIFTMLSFGLVSEYGRLIPNLIPPGITAVIGYSAFIVAALLALSVVLFILHEFEEQFRTLRLRHR
ncbi:hypothetical protein SAMN05421858_5060 [Haladaptatus litoreus]|uniref:Uncharacterized protein n=1 Tax=Haladaptatus litoreus TaxID=553468 RepID=A0A1N7FHI9_9EURY|nr:hypothetical protein [Haladaptatus litoreus]SIR99760.1 hypothetical protein SAMN05421858_5060 [Haladaptatus litoreus]